MSDEPQFGDRYRLLWRKSGPKQIGEVRNFTTDGSGCRAIHILLDDELMERISMRFVATSWGDRGPEIHVSSAFMTLSRELREAGIWHEVGHVHYKHYSRHDFRDQAQLRVARISAVERGEVLPLEEEADRFAVARAGKECVVGFLRYLLATRPTGRKLGWNDIGRRELELRIAAIEAL